MLLNVLAPRQGTAGLGRPVVPGPVGHPQGRDRLAGRVENPPQVENLPHIAASRNGSEGGLETRRRLKTCPTWRSACYFTWMRSE